MKKKYINKRADFCATVTVRDRNALKICRNSDFN